MTTYLEQIGGAHYEQGGEDVEEQHWDLMDRWDMEYLPATASKYVVRYDRKGTPVLDLQKSISYLQKQLLCHPNKGCRRTIPSQAVVYFLRVNKLSAKKELLIHLIHVEGTPRALRRAIEIMKETIDADYSNQATTAQP